MIILRIILYIPVPYLCQNKKYLTEKIIDELFSSVLALSGGLQRVQFAKDNFKVMF